MILEKAPQTTNEKMDYNTAVVHLTNTIRRVHTYLDIMETSAKTLSGRSNSFWDLIFLALYELVIIESCKLIDKSRNSLSLKYVMREIKSIKPAKKSEVEKDIKNLNQYTKGILKLIRDNKIAHNTTNINLNLSRIADLGEILDLLAFSEEVLSKYTVWTIGKQHRIHFTSVFPGGHKNMLKYISRLINT